ncbi:hypothetical protein ACKU27_05410 [Sphingobium yanoikuyae]|uniref:hypothetical protein n=1 Tax=Sphingobium yanoikuyae TaxID=13690 RepID=UPI003B90F07A
MGSQALKFPKSPEIKRLIKAARDAGMQIGSIDIRPDGVTIYPPAKEQGQSPYDIWKAQNQS